MTERKHWSVRLAAVVWLGTSAGCVVAPPAAAPAAPPAAPAATGPAHKTAFAGEPLTIGTWFSLHPDCTLAGYDELIVARSPGHGSLAIAHGEGYPAYASTNQRYDCNKQLHPGVTVVYTPAAGYVGTDAFALRWVGPSGDDGWRDYAITIERHASDAAAGASARP
jgi:hypothetical protein